MFHPNSLDSNGVVLRTFYLKLLINQHSRNITEKEYKRLNDTLLISYTDKPKLWF